MAGQKVTKRVVDSLTIEAHEYAVWDAKMPGFGVRVRPTGAKSYVVVYRAGSGRCAPVRRYTIAAVGKITPEKARDRARAILGAVAHGRDPAEEKTSERQSPTVSELADRFLREYVDPKRKPGTAATYRYVIESTVKSHIGGIKVDKLTRNKVARMHSALRETPSWANRTLAVVSSMYTFAAHVGLVQEGTNPARRIDKFAERPHERFLTGEELERLGSAIREAETRGIPWDVTEANPKAKHLPKSENPEYCTIAQDACKRGATDSDLAEIFRVSRMTIVRWRLEHPEFCDATKVGKEIADDRMERSLYERGVGYTVDAVKPPRPMARAGGQQPDH
jgi:hypothetical protein